MLIKLLALILLAAWLLVKSRRRPPRRRRVRRPRNEPLNESTRRHSNHRKPEWVRKEVLRRKALGPGLSCRQLASGFNVEFQHSRQMTVGHSWVAVMVKTHEDDIQQQRKAVKARKLRPGPKNRVWGLDLTEVATTAGPVTVLGAIDHGTRACLALEALGSKATIQILRVLLDIIERFGKPTFVRTDNESVFNSRRFRACLIFLGIRQQLTQVASPWQNGRIERFFGTLKQRWRARAPPPASWTELTVDLQRFRTWYNQVRPHQHLGGLPPAWLWDGKTKRSSSLPSEHFEAWNGALTGFYLRP